MRLLICACSASKPVIWAKGAAVSGLRNNRNTLISSAALEVVRKTVSYGSGRDDGNATHEPDRGGPWIQRKRASQAVEDGVSAFCRSSPSRSDQCLPCLSVSAARAARSARFLQRGGTDQHHIATSRRDGMVAFNRASHGRTRLRRWGERCIDLDLLLYDEIQMDCELLTLPHPRAHERRFVLDPLIELLGEDYDLPGRGPCIPSDHNALRRRFTYSVSSRDDERRSC